MKNFRQMLEVQWSRGNFVCIGLDSELNKLPNSVLWHGSDSHISVFNTLVAFNRAIVEATHDLVCAYKPNTAFYEAHGDEGFAALHRTINDIQRLAPDVPVILDAKRADISNTNTSYAVAAFDCLQVDAITVNPYLGSVALQPFLERVDKGIIVLCRTSNPGAGELQDLPVNGEPLYRFIASRVANHWNKNGNCALIVGATVPEELHEVRQLVGDMPILIPGIGSQGADIKKTVYAGKDSRGQGMIINSSRSIIFASKGDDFAQAARRETIKLRDTINQYR